MIIAALTQIWCRFPASPTGNVGTACHLEKQGKLDDGLTAYQNSVAIDERLANADPTDVRSQSNLAEDNARLASMFLQHGNRRYPAFPRRRYGGSATGSRHSDLANDAGRTAARCP